MAAEEALEPLSLLSTCWSLVCRARQGGALAVRSAQRSLLDRYGPAIRRYLRAAVRNDHAAEDLYQEFALRLVRGDLHGADRQRGRFRDFVRGVLVHLVADHHKRRQRDDRLHVRVAQVARVTQDQANGVALESDTSLDEAWREQALHLAWTALARLKTEGGPLLYTVLRCRADHPDLRSPALAQHLSCRLGYPVKAANVRQLLHRARLRFAELLLHEVVEGLDDSTCDEVERELEELHLLHYCRPALEKMVARA